MFLDFSLKGLILCMTTGTNNNNPKKEIQKKQGKQGLGPSCGSPGKESRLFWSESSWRNTRSHGIRLSLQTAGKTNPAWPDTYTPRHTQSQTHVDTHIVPSAQRLWTCCTRTHTHTKLLSLLTSQCAQTMLAQHTPCEKVSRREENDKWAFIALPSPTCEHFRCRGKSDRYAFLSLISNV